MPVRDGAARIDRAVMGIAVLGVLGLLAGIILRCSEHPARPRPVTHIMIIGDSICEGEEGDVTWRYRLWQHLSADGVRADFVGPKTGAWNMYYATDDAPYRYAGWDSHHDCGWGLQLHQAIGTVFHDVAIYRPDVLLVQLGSDDLQQRVTDAAGFLADMTTLITRARAAVPGIRFVIGTVPPRTSLGPRFAFLPGTIATADRMLATGLPKLATRRSPIQVADLVTGRHPATDTHDGVHPDGRAEYLIAAAFARGLARLGLGRSTFPVPATVPPPSLEPVNLTVTSASTLAGVQLRWSQVPSADGFWIASVDLTLRPHGVPRRLPYAIRGDRWTDAVVVAGHTMAYQVTSRASDSEEGPASPVVTVAIPP